MSSLDELLDAYLADADVGPVLADRWEEEGFAGADVVRAAVTAEPGEQFSCRLFLLLSPGGQLAFAVHAAQSYLVAWDDRDGVVDAKHVWNVLETARRGRSRPHVDWAIVEESLEQPLDGRVAPSATAAKAFASLASRLAIAGGYAAMRPEEHFRQVFERNDVQPPAELALVVQCLRRASREQRVGAPIAHWEELRRRPSMPETVREADQAVHRRAERDRTWNRSMGVLTLGLFLAGVVAIARNWPPEVDPYAPIIAISAAYGLLRWLLKRGDGPMFPFSD